MSSALTRIATYRLSARTNLCIAHGSVVDFSFPSSSKSAIVNAANEGCLGGGGVDGAISAAGGINLHKDREALPVRMGARCFTGDAKLTGPGDYGTLNVKYVIHAVGPNYYDYPSLREGDSLLSSAYKASLKLACQENLEAVAFALLSAGIYRGGQTVKNVLKVGVTSIRDFVADNEDCSLTDVFLCGFNPKEVKTLVGICDRLQLESVAVEEEDIAAEEENDCEEDSSADEQKDSEAEEEKDSTEDEKKDGAAEETKDDS